YYKRDKNKGNGTKYTPCRIARMRKGRSYYMHSIIDLQMIVYPDLLDVMQQRFNILKMIHILEPIGRRSLAEQIDLKERVVRNEIDFLTQQGLLQVTQKGVMLTNSGAEITNA